MSYALPKWTDGNLSTAVACSLPEFEAPIPGDATEYVFNQNWRQFRNNYDSGGPLALNTAHPTYTSFVLVEEGPRRDIGGAVVEFTRKYAKLPATHYDWDMFGYSFPGTLTSISGGTNITRPRAVRVAISRIEYDYFLVPTSGSTSVTDPITGTTYSISSPGDIARIQDMVYCYQNTVGGALYGGITMATDILNPAGSSLPTWPTSDDYNTMVADALSNGWGGTLTKVVLFPTNTLAGGPPPTSGHMAGTIDLTSTPHSVLGGLIPAEPSRLTRWLGNYYQRATRYVLAQ